MLLFAFCILLCLQALTIVLASVTNEKTRQRVGVCFKVYKYIYFFFLLQSNKDRRERTRPLYPDTGHIFYALVWRHIYYYHMFCTLCLLNFSIHTNVFAGLFFPKPMQLTENVVLWHKEDPNLYIWLSLYIQKKKLTILFTKLSIPLYHIHRSFRIYLMYAFIMHLISHRHEFRGDKK